MKPLLLIAWVISISSCSHQAKNSDSDLRRIDAWLNQAKEVESTDDIHDTGIIIDAIVDSEKYNSFVEGKPKNKKYLYQRLYRMTQSDGRYFFTDCLFYRNIISKAEYYRLNRTSDKNTNLRTFMKAITDNTPIISQIYNYDIKINKPEN